MLVISDASADTIKSSGSLFRSETEIENVFWRRIEKIIKCTCQRALRRNGSTDRTIEALLTTQSAPRSIQAQGNLIMIN